MPLTVGKFRRSLSLNAKRLGAIGDGVADDTEALQSAIEQAEQQEGGSLYIPAGVYRTTAQLRIRRPIKIEGTGGGQGDNSSNRRGSLILCQATAGNAAILVQPDATAAIWGLAIRDLGINGNTVADGIVLSAINGQTISQSAFENLIIRDCRDGVRSSGTTAAGVYQNEFRNIKMTGCRRAGFDMTANSSYNQITNIEATMHTSATGYGVRVEGTGTTLRGVMTEGTVSLNMPWGTAQGIHIENLVPTSPAGGGVLFSINGTNITVRNISITSVNKNVTDYGLSVFSERATIDNVIVTGSDGPRYVWNPQTGSSGTLSNVRVQTTHFTAEQGGYTDSQIYGNWTYVNASGSEGVVAKPDSKEVNVTAFGAKFDGTTNDTTAIQAAITAAGEGVVVFPANASARVNNLTLSNYTKINGNGATLLPATGATKILSIPRQNLLQTTKKGWVKDLNIDGVTTASGLIGVDIDGHAAFVLERVGVTRCDIGFNIAEGQFCSMHDCAAFLNNVGMLHKSKTSTGGGNSWSFYDFRAVQNAVGVVLSKDSGSAFPYHSIYFRNPSILTNTVCGIAAFDVDHLCLDGGAPELNGSGAATYTVDGRTVKRSSMHFNDSRVELVNTPIQEPSVTPCIILENGAHLAWVNAAGYGSTTGRLIDADSTSSVDISGHLESRAVIEGVRRFEGTLLSSDGSLLTTVFPQSSSDIPNNIATSQKPGLTWTSTATSNADGTDTIFGDYNEGTFAATVGTTEANRLLRQFTSDGALIAVSFQVRASVATTVRFCLYPATPPRDYRLQAGVWHRVFFFTNAAASGTQYVLGYPLDTAGATLRLAKWQVFSGADNAVNRGIAARIASGVWRAT